MLSKEIRIRAGDTVSALNEIKFEVATARVEGAELLIIDYPDGEGMCRFLQKASNVLRKMKQRRSIQLYAFAENFSREGTESVYLKNKYSELFMNYFPDKEDRRVYIKL